MDYILYKALIIPIQKTFYNGHNSVVRQPMEDQSLLASCWLRSTHVLGHGGDSLKGRRVVRTSGTLSVKVVYLLTFLTILGMHRSFTMAPGENLFPHGESNQRTSLSSEPNHSALVRWVMLQDLLVRILGKFSNVTLDFVSEGTTNILLAALGAFTKVCQIRISYSIVWAIS